MVLRRAAFLALAVVCCCATATGCARNQLPPGTVQDWVRWFHELGAENALSGRVVVGRPQAPC